MPTSPATTCKPGRARFSARASRAGGFTLIELVLVLAVLAIVMLLALPAFQAVLQSTVDKEVTRLSGAIRLLRNEAVLTRKPFRLVIDLKERQYWVEEWTLEGRYVERSRPAILAKHRFPSAMKLKDLILNGNTRYPLIDRRVDLTLDVSGFMDPFALRFAVGEVNYTLEFAGFTSEVNLVKTDADK